MKQKQFVRTDGNGGSKIVIELPKFKPRHTRAGMWLTSGVVLTALIFLFKAVFATGGKAEKLETVIIHTQENSQSIRENTKCIGEIKVEITKTNNTNNGVFKEINGKLDILLEDKKLVYVEKDDTL